MNVIDFIRESAAFMAKDRPDIYTPESAVQELDHAIEMLRTCKMPVGCVMFTSYVLNRVEDSGIEEFLLTRKLSSVLVCEEETSCLVFAFTPEIDLPGVNESQEDYDLDDDD